MSESIHTTVMLCLDAPAKLNLSLRVLGLRPDGYHEVETVFERIDLADELTFSLRADPAIRLTCDHPTLSVGPDNLVVKAALAVQRAANVTTGAEMHLIKRVPVAAGLGGGSSDAATTLIGANRVWGDPLPVGRLKELAAALGSDVPFFLEDTAFALGAGRGEQCRPILSQATCWHVLVVPKAELSTKAIYEAWDVEGAGAKDLTAGPASSRIIEHALSNGPDLSGLAQGLQNDLAPAAIRRCPLIRTIYANLMALGCVGAVMSGSGPSVFGLCRDAEQAEDVARRISAQDGSWFVQVVKTYRVHEV